MNKYHTREGYEALYKRLYKEERSKHALPLSVERLSDYQLLQKINCELGRLNCIELTFEEMEKELH